MYELVLMIVGLFIASFVYSNSKWFRLQALRLFMLPVFVEYEIRYRSYMYNTFVAGYFLKRDRLTKYLKRMTQSEIKFLKVEQEILNVFEDFLGEKEMALRLNKKSEVHRYVPVLSRSADEPPILLMKKVGALKAAQIRDGSYKLDRQGRLKSTHTLEVQLKLCVESFVGWENVTDEDGHPVEFDKDNRFDMFDMLPGDLQDELLAVFGSGKYSKVAEESVAETLSRSDDEDEDSAVDDEGDDA